MVNEQLTPDRRDEGSIGIGAMIVFIALILVAAVASTIIIKTAEELQQNAENTSSDTRQQISGKVSIADVYVKTTADALGAGAGDTDVATMEVIARISSGSLNVQEGDISYYVSCKVSYSDGSATFATVDSGTANSLELDGTDITTGTEITAGTTFKFEIDLAATNVEDGDAVITAADFATSTPPGCDAEAGAGEELELRVVVDGGGETLANLKIESITLGKSMM
jgi:archaellin|tara:strand:- start:224 stop:898 length:675 start_codon:yes stop_codon:yes gene_type:complete